MKFNVIEILKQFNVSHTTEHHHATEGAVQVNCPSCGDSNFHLGIGLDGSWANCWRCGKLDPIEVLSSLTGLSSREVFKQAYSHKSTNIISPPQRTKRTYQITEVKLPIGTNQIQASHSLYLARRGFNPESLVEIWGIQGTGHIGPYKHRIVIPVLHCGRLVCYTTRDITELSPLRYKNCPSEEEIRPIKNCLYGLDLVPNKRVIVTEGPLDVWKIGAGAVATFGIQWTQSQVLLLRKFKFVAILYDNEPQAQKQAEKLGWALGDIGIEYEIFTLREGKDPGGLSDNEIRSLRREIFG